MNNLLISIPLYQEKSGFGPDYKDSDTSSYEIDLGSNFYELTATEKEQLDQFKAKYYLHKLKFNDMDRPYTHICIEYINALNWIMQYYLKGVPSWTWCYPYHYAPFCSDILETAIVSTEFQIDQPYDSIVQLSCMLSNQSFNILPDQIRNYLTSETCALIDMFPTSFQCDQNGKTQDYESIVLIPFPDMRRVAEYLSPIINKLDSNTLQLNRVADNFIFEHDPQSVSNISTTVIEHASLCELKRRPVRIIATKTLSYVSSWYQPLTVPYHLFPSFNTLQFTVIQPNNFRLL
uniref:5'-3' exoribonuclease 1 (Trinotate prediction) n=1 Tax=Henneguya salminicola TaxID=69463 RepID=A0A6G3MDI4_HENSL